MPAGEQGECRAQDAVDQDPVNKGGEQDVEPHAREGNCRDQEEEEDGDGRPEDLSPGETLHLGGQGRERRQCLRCVEVALHPPDVPGADDREYPLIPAPEHQDLVRKVGIPFIDQGLGAARRKLPELFHRGAHHVLVRELVHVDLLVLDAHQ